MQSYNPDLDPWRRGIHRTNAQSLTLSLAPLDAPRPLLFRIKANLARLDRGTSEQLGFLEESPSTYSSASLQLKTTNLPTGKRPLSIVTPLSTTSVYSQDSWNPDAPAIVPTVDPDSKRHTIEFKPSSRWSDSTSPASGSPVAALSTRSVWAAPPTSPVASSPSSARLKMNIFTSASRKFEGDGNEDDFLTGSIRVVDEPKPVVAVRLQIPKSEASSLTAFSSKEKGSVVLHNSDFNSDKDHNRISTESESENLTSKKDAKSSRFMRILNRLSKPSFGYGKIKEVTRTSPKKRAAGFSSLKLPDLRLSPVKLAFDTTSLQLPEQIPDQEKNGELEYDPFPSLAPIPTTTISQPTVFTYPTTVPPKPVFVSPPVSNMQPGPIPTFHPSTGPQPMRRSKSSPASPRNASITSWSDPANIPPMPPLPSPAPSSGYNPQPASVHVRPKMKLTIPSDTVVVVPNNEPRPRPPRAVRPPGHSYSFLEIKSEEGIGSIYSPLQTKAERWEEIIATTPVTPAALWRGKSLSRSFKHKYSASFHGT